MLKNLLSLLIICSFLVAMAANASQGVAIQRVITNTRSELGQLASSSKAREIANQMRTFDTQYKTWSSSCGGGENFDPNEASDACKAMAEQMRETGIQLYGKLSEYLPDVAARYEQGARGANRIIEMNAMNQTAASLYQSTMDGITDTPPPLGQLSSGEEDTPFDLEVDDFPDPTEKMFAVLEKLVPDFGKEIPEAVRAGNAQVSMMKKAKHARYLAAKFQKAKFVLESQREYGEIIFNATNAVGAMPQVLGLQYTGTRLTAKPNQKVLDFYRKGNKADTAKKNEKQMGGFAPRS
ncbi:hypothetical protein DSCO28_36500 [Desulfosarcina ovata subsp. sediminis]|uniref:Uncharacterized protein n=1 Tax=Desulfosarcina ovata subsp. sediminis TaxID=885957 RepID=A0A5K7ZSB5_9BACT|nr:hypothetical protein [Desulfosarcina ovata]BBO83084.1 hypothetical protein DSCO28_36500 [Desulfosarcina ovata subsp. sediminis]